MEKILVIGHGGREMALVKAFLRSPSVSGVICARGSDGIAELCPCFDIPEDDFTALIELTRHEQISLVVVGPEQPLAAGISDAFANAGIDIFAPTQAAARIESSKAYAKKLMQRVGVPSAACQIFQDKASALSYVEQAAYPLVLKEDGLRGGKGVRICFSVHEALAHLEDLRVDKDNRLVAEQFLEGFEFSLIVLADGTRTLPLPLAQDHKAIGDGNKGPNTGGMGAVSPVPRVSEELQRLCLQKIIEPVLKGLVEEGHPFRGFLYAGLMMTAEGPEVIEFNARLGDPEAEVILPRLRGDLAQAIRHLINGASPEPLPVCKESCLGVVLAAPGYPEKLTGSPLLPPGLMEEVRKSDDLDFIHMGSKKISEKQWQAAGGRVCLVSALAPDIPSCRERLYGLLDRALPPDGGFTFRRDIGNYAEKN